MLQIECSRSTNKISVAMGFVVPLSELGGKLVSLGSWHGQRVVRNPTSCRRPLRRVKLPLGFSVHACASMGEHTEAMPISSSSSSIDPAVETLALLEWPALSRRVASLTSTVYGRDYLLRGNGMLEVPSAKEQSERLLALTREAYFLEYVLAKPLPFGGMHDVMHDVEMTRKGLALSGPQLMQIAETLDAARKLRRHVETAVAPTKEDAFRDLDGGVSSDESDLKTKLAIFRNMVSKFKTWPDVEAQIRETLDDFGEVLDSCDPKLAGLRSGIRDVISTVRSRLQSLMSAHSGAIQDRVITSRFDRFVIPVKISHKSEFRKGVVHDVSASGSTAFIEPQAVRALNDKLRELVASEKACVSAILRKLSVEVVARTADDIAHICSVAGILDAACARARASFSLNAHDVSFTSVSGAVRLYNARHPLLSWKAMDEEKFEDPGSDKADSKSCDFSGVDQFSAKTEKLWKRSVVPSDFIVPEGVRCVCVTGPNTGGKTISLKTLGMIVLMAKAGLFVPADFSRTSDVDNYTSAKAASDVLQAGQLNGDPGNDLGKYEELLDQVDSPHSLVDEVVCLPYFDNVLADIGDDQSLVQSLSTFSGHIERIKRILRRATPNSLVLFDEIGSGTDPAEGAALGMALLRYLAGADGGGHKAALTFATTHHGELKTLKYSENRDGTSLFENASVEFDHERMAPTFKLLWGIPGRSNALAIASRLGLQKEIVAAADELLLGEMGNGRVDVSNMVAELESEKKLAEIARMQTAEAWTEVSSLRDELRSRLDSLRSSEQKLRNEKRVLLERELEEAKKQIGGVIKEMQQAGRSARYAGKASSTIDEIRKDVSSSFSDVVSTMSNEERDDLYEKLLQQTRVGSRVLVPRLGSKPVEVVELDRSKEEISVLVGVLRAKIKLREVSEVVRAQPELVHDSVVDARALARKQAKRELKASRRHGSAAKTVMKTSANTVDVRGQSVDEAEANVDQAISRSLMSGCTWIIHGHGTGRLKTGLHAYLKDHPSVERYVVQ